MTKIVQTQDEDTIDTSEASTIVTASSIKDRALKAAKQSLEVKAFNDQAHKYVEAKDETKRSPLFQYKNLVNLYGKGKLDAWPMPGSGGKGREGENNPAIYYVKKRNAAGKDVKTRFDYYVDYAMATVEGLRIQVQLDLIAEAEKGDDTVAKDNPYRGIDPGHLNADKRMYNGQKDSLASLYRTAISIHHQLKAFAEFPTVKVTIRTRPSKDGKSRVYTNSTIPFQIRSVPANDDEAIQHKEFSVGAFIRLDLKLAQAKGGTYEAIIGSANREGDTTTSKVPPFKLATIEDALSEMVTFFEDDALMAAFYKKANSKDESGQPANADMIANVNDLWLALGPVVKKYRNEIAAYTGSKTTAKVAAKAKAIAADDEPDEVTSDDAAEDEEQAA